MRRQRRKQNDLTLTRSARIAAEVAGVILIALIAAAVIWRDHITVESILAYTPSNLWLAALAFMGLYAVKGLTAVVYVKLLYVAAGLVFPLPAALIVNTVGSAVELMLPYLLGRAGGRGAARFIARRYPKLGRVSALRRRSNFWFCAFVRAVGLFPVDPASIYFGACGMPVVPFLLGSVAGVLPTMIVSTVLGTAADTPGSPEFIISLVLFFGLQAGAAAAFWIWIRKNNAAISAAEKEASSHEHP